jgi:hypothetical protein
MGDGKRPEPKPGEKPTVIPVAYIYSDGNDGLWEVYEKTNSINDSWVTGRDKGVMIGLRSSSVGDLIEDTAKKIFYMIDRVGFKEVRKEDYNFLRFTIQ